ncbi:hypothetical protein H8D30_04490 [bacterium]|nr:hypothetical protein [bacterium]
MAGDLWTLLSELSWGWPREWEELILIVGIALLATLIFHFIVFFVKITVKLVVVALVALLIYSAMTSSTNPLVMTPDPVLPPTDTVETG